MKRAARYVPVGLWVLWGLYAIGMFATLPLVPFHPDEATHIWLSNDFDQLFWQLDPAGVTWSTPTAAPMVNHYRLLEAPLSRYLIGLSRTLTGQHDLRQPVDWIWKGDWATNVAAGAVPGATLLFVARLPATIGTIMGALLVFAIGRRVGGLVTGVSAAGLYAANSLLWLHGRRAMSEGLTVFAMLLAVWVILRWGQRAVAVGAAVAVAAAAKLTGVALLPAATLAVILAHRSQPARRWLRPALLLIVSFCATSLILNPALWAPPAGVLSSMLLHRTTLLADQTANLRAAGGPVVDTLAQQTFALVYQLYLAPLAFWEVPNYAAATAAAEVNYQTVPWHLWFHGPTVSANLVAGGLLLTLTLLGVAFSALRAWRPGPTPWQPGERRALVLLAVCTLGVTAALYAIHIAWQRYYLPLVPLVCLWSGLGLAALARPLTTRWRARQKP